MRRIVTVSGVHGVGKDSMIAEIGRLQKVEAGPTRPPNPFLTPYEAMLFFISAFAWRDRQIKAADYPHPIIIDRWAFVDIRVYINTLASLRHITGDQSTSLLSALNTSYCAELQPDVAILIDDEPELILERIMAFPEASKHHILERDLNFISLLRSNFLEDFAELRRPNKPPAVHIVKRGGRTALSLATEVIPIIKL